MAAASTGSGAWTRADELRYRVRRLWPLLRSPAGGVLLLAGPIAIGRAVGWATCAPELGVQVAGVGLEAYGLLIVAHGLEQAARLLGVKTTGDRLQGWFAETWAALRGVRQAITLSVDSAHHGHTVADARLTVGPGPMSTVDRRLFLLEQKAEQFAKEIDALKATLDSHVSKLVADLETYRKETREAIDELSKKVRELSGDGMHVESFGLVLVFVGAVLATFSEPASRYWPFAAT